VSHPLTKGNYLAQGDVSKNPWIDFYDLPEESGIHKKHIILATLQVY